MVQLVVSGLSTFLAVVLHFFLSLVVDFMVVHDAVIDVCSVCSSFLFLFLYSIYFAFFCERIVP